MSFILSPDHHSVTTAPDMQDICYPLFRHTEITHFVYARIFDNGESFGLNSHAKWQLHHFNAEHMALPPIPKKILNNRCSFILSQENAPESFKRTIDDFRHILGIDYPYFMIERYQNFYDLYVFCTSVDNKDIITFYLNEQDHIENFKKYFKSKAKNLIKEASENKILLPNKLRPNIDWSTANQKQSLPDFQPQQYIVHYKGQDIAFSPKEAKCLKFLSIGHDTKGVATMMNISRRTVEFHINSIKSKMKLGNKTQVLVELYEQGVETRLW